MGNSNLHWTEETYIKYGDIVFDLLTAPPDTYSRTPEQVEFINSILKQHHPSFRKILDIPCGDGRISIGLAKRGYAEH